MSDTVTYYIVKGTFALLILFSALTWTVVFVKAVQVWRLGQQDRAFGRLFAKATGFPSASSLHSQAGPKARVAIAAVDVWSAARGVTDSPDGSVDVRRDVLERGIRTQIQRERRGAEAGLPILASIGSTAPFIGLFGTVLGIIHALSRIGSMGSASLDVVAGPIGEALVATGIGIAVAVPAVLAYNFFVRKLKGFGADLEDLANSLVNQAIVSLYRATDSRPLRREPETTEGALSVAQEASA
jgi:biopolymer transport protein ExbB